VIEPAHVDSSPSLSRKVRPRPSPAIPITTA
jgi:hypothetical protein